MITLSTAQKTALETAEKYREIAVEVGNTIWNFAETGLHEYHSAAYLIEFYKNHGFEVESGLAGFPTGFRATFSTGEGVNVGLICEYDALPQMSCEKIGENGHGCGHSLFSASSTAIAMLLHDVMTSCGIKGTITVFGTPAEECYGAKAYFAKCGYFDNLDCSVGLHAHDENLVEFSVLAGTIVKRYTFHGKPAHAGNCPWLGISALDAVEIMNVAVNYMREHVRPDARIQYVITQGGGAANVVPDLAQSEYMFRAADVPYLDEMEQRIDNCAKGAALATGCTVDIEFLDKTYNTVLIREFAELAQQYLELVGIPQYTEQEKADAMRFGNGTGFSNAILPLSPVEGYRGGASDEGDLSWVVPHVSIHVANMALGTAPHTLGYTEQANMSAAYTALATQAKAVALLLLDIMEHPEKAKMLKAAHKKKLGGNTYPKDRNACLPAQFNPNCEGVKLEDDLLTLDFESIPLLSRGFAGTVQVMLNGETIASFKESGSQQVRTKLEAGSILQLFANDQGKKQLLGVYKK